MGIIDGVADTFSKGAAAAERSSNQIKIKARLSDLEKQREKLCSELGAALFRLYDNSASYPQGTEDLFVSIETLDNEVSSLKQQLIELSRPPAASQSLVCQACGKSVSPDDAFCGSCGAKIEKPSPSVLASQPAGFCTSCGSQLFADQAFCIICGSKVVKYREQFAEDVANETPPVASDVTETETSHADVVTTGESTVEDETFEESTFENAKDDTTVGAVAESEEQVDLISEDAENSEPSEKTEDNSTSASE